MKQTEFIKALESLVFISEEDRTLITNRAEPLSSEERKKLYEELTAMNHDEKKYAQEQSDALDNMESVVNEAEHNIHGAEKEIRKSDEVHENEAGVSEIEKELDNL